ncbi:hypothetical protein AQUCO_00900117v1 [Aquilegia coerulea]|uniref:PRLI-interacting factor A n=1 Tax=Aquilegia coerulea TaxID=218851 RepID=A0A2G5ECM8_AQUCA|nr:hypothetical protein AQUCO_00900117v1 [Aquilegia coerulea]PIA53318.1 hypothetical protein AQUCO_00900117v1 [Aquilegia coerulea]PIA53319.1 hypothetical protein AQUCO_00900117v1 [Aquilegia coerulea]
MNDQSQIMNLNQSSSSSSHMMNRNYGGAWSLVPPPDDPMKFMNNRQGFMPAPKPGRRNNNWKGKKGKKGGVMIGSGSNTGIGGGGGGGGGVGGGGGYKPPTLHELQSQNRMKAQRFYPKKKFNNRFAPYAPRNTTSFIIRAKKSGGIASLVSPCPVTPAVLPTPIFSPSREVLVDMAKEEWGVDGYGSMNGLIRLRSPGQEINEVRDDEEEEEGGSSESDVEEHVEVERRLDHDLSRFEMIYPNFADENGNILENHMDDQDAHVAQLEEENLTLKERLFLMERELIDLKKRLQCLETESRAKKESKDGSLENERGSSKEENNDVTMINEGEGGKEENNDEDLENESVGEKEENNDDEASENEGCGDVCSEKSFCDGD